MRCSFPGVKHIISVAALLALLLGLVPAIDAQQGNGSIASVDTALERAAAGERLRIRTESGATFQGTLYRLESDRLELVDADGRIVVILRERITGIESIAETGDDRDLFQDSASNRLVVMPTAFPLEAGEFHVTSQEIVAVTGSYGINDWLSVWGGISIPGGLFSLRASTMVGESAGISVGSFVGLNWFDLSLGPLVLPYALASFGTPDNNVSIGSGFLGLFSDGGNIPGAVFALAGKRTLTSGTALVTENWIVFGERSRFNDVTMQSEDFWTAVPLAIAPSLAFRIANDRLSWDIGAVVPFLINESSGDYSLNDPVIPIPILSITYRIR